MSWLRGVALVALLWGSLFPPLAGVDLVLAGGVLAALLVVIDFRSAAPRLRAIAPITVLLVGVLLLPVAAGGMPTSAYGIEKVQRLLTVTLATMLAVALVRDRRDLVTFAKVMALAGLLLGVVSVTGATTAGGRAVGFDSNPVWLGRALSSALIATAWLGLRRHWRLPVVTIGIVATAGGLLATASRGPMLGMLFGLLMLVAYQAGRVGPRGVAALHFFLAGAIAWLVLSEHQGTRRLVEVLTAPGEQLDASSRGEFWSATLPVIAGGPLGVGYGGWGAATLAPSHIRYPHNLFLEVFAEAGWLPGVILVGVTAAVLLRLGRAARREPAALLMLSLLAVETVSVSTSGDLGARTFFAFLVLGHIVSRWLSDGDRPERLRGTRRASRRAYLADRSTRNLSRVSNHVPS